jgi:hypothetical protein
MRTSQAAKATGKLDEEDDIVVSRLGHGTFRTSKQAFTAMAGDGL